MVFPRLRDHHHHGVRHRVPAHQQELERIVERRGIRLPGVNQRPHLLQISTEDRARDRTLTCAYPVDVAAQRVDLTVVRDQPEGMREVPRRKGVRGKALVHERKGRGHPRVLQVLVIGADLVGEQHAFVDDGARRHRRHVELLAVRELERLDRMSRSLADDVELAFQRIGNGDTLAATDEDLADDRLDFLDRCAETRIVAGNVAPPKQYLPFIFDRALYFVLARKPRGGLFRQKDHSHAILPERWQFDALRGQLLSKQSVRNLQKNAGAIASERIGAHRSAMREVAQDLQALLNDGVALGALDVRDETDAARVVLVGGVIEALGQAADQDRSRIFSKKPLLQAVARPIAALRNGRTQNSERNPLSLPSSRAYFNQNFYVASCGSRRHVAARKKCGFSGRLQLSSIANSRRCSRMA